MHSSKPSTPHSSPFLRFSLLFLLLSLIILLYSQTPPFLRPQNPTPTPTTTAAAFRRVFLSLSATANATISGDLRSLTLHPHLAGDPSAATLVLSRLRRSGIPTLARDFIPLLSFPFAASLSLLHPNLTLQPLPLSDPDDPTSAVIPPYHAFSPSGAALAPAVFINYGRDADYQTLDSIGVDVRGCIAIARRGGVYRGAVVESAAKRGAAAVLMFSDRGPGVERGTVGLRGAGDFLTPGWAAMADGERLKADDEEVRWRSPAIPSMPVSSAVAAEILKTMGGPPLPHEWREGMTATAGGVGGRGGGPALVNFTYREDKKLTTIRDVFGVIRGREEPDRYVILGNHRDAWTYGAVDPNSGTAALLDVARRYGVLFQSGWRPRRTIILCSWDAEEFGMIGSTEWVEQNIGNLGSKAVAYLNVDCAVQGPGFFAGATPQLDKLLVEITKQIKDPDSESKTVHQTWVARNGGISIERLARADSDFSPFLHHAGVPSVDLYYGEAFPGYHTVFDSYDWMAKFGDPMFLRHVAIAEIWGLLGLHLADDSVLPFYYLSYVVQLQEHTNALRSLLDVGESVKPINASIHELASAANEAQEEVKKMQEPKSSEELKRRALNDRLMLTERGFLEAEGLRGRRWFKHLLYSPPADYESNFSFFPGIADAISRKDGIQHEIWRVARAIERAAKLLRGELI